MTYTDVSNATRVAVLGAGNMAPGIAAVFAGGGFESMIYARRSQAGESARGRALAQRKVLVDNHLAGTLSSSIEYTDDLEEALAGADIVVEAIAEDLTTKQSLFREVESLVEADSILASTTSGLDIADMSEGARNPSRFVVMHFWNPAHLVPLVEVVGSEVTAPGLVADVCDLLRRLGKYPVPLLKYVPGFIGVRLQQAVVREAIALLEAGVASAANIDAATRLSFGARFPVLGPLETSDLGGLDVIAAIHRYLLPDLDCSQEPQRLLETMVDQGHLGVKTGAGFYDWSRRDASELTDRRDKELLRRVKSLLSQGDLTIALGNGDRDGD